MINNDGPNQPGDNIAKPDGQKGDTNSDRIESPLLVDFAKGIEKCKDKGVTETAKKGKE
jgi:hypothetical protein